MTELINNFKVKFDKYKKEKMKPYFSNPKNMFYYVLFLIVLAFAFYIITILTNSFTAPITGDYTVQSIPFFYNGWDDWWHFFTTGEFPFWDSSLALGGDNIANNSFYYIFDPFFLIVLLFPRSFIPHAMLISMMIRMILATLFFRLLLKYFGVKETTARVFSVCYGFGGWMVFYQWFAGFNGICTFLPIVLLGIEKLLKTKKPYVLILGLFLIGISNFYFLIPVGIGGVFYALFRYFQTIKTRKSYDNFIVAGLGILAFALGICCSGFVTLPSILNALTYQRATNDYLKDLIGYIQVGDVTNTLNQIFDWGFVFGDYYSFRWIYPLMAFLFPATDGRNVPVMNFDGNRYDTLASSIFVFTPLILIFFASIIKSTRERKFSHLIAIAFFMLALFTPFFYYLFLGFSEAYGRWELIPYAFIILFCAISFNKRKKYKIYDFAISYLVTIILMGVCIYYAMILPDESTRIEPIGARWLVIIISLIYVSVLFFLFIKYYKDKRFVKTGILFIAAEVVLMGAYYNYFHGYTDYESIYFLNGKENVARETEIFKTINEEDKSFFRVQSDRIYDSGTNLNMAENYNGLSYFHSEYNSNTDQFLHWSNIVTSYGNWNGNAIEKRPLLDTFLGVKYYLTNAVETNYRVIYDTNDESNSKVIHYDPNIPFGYKVSYQDSDYTVYENENFIEMGFSFTNFIDPQVSSNEDGANPMGVLGDFYYFTNSGRGHFDADYNFLKGAILETQDINELKQNYTNLWDEGYFSQARSYYTTPTKQISIKVTAYDLKNSYFNPDDPLAYQTKGEQIYTLPSTGSYDTDSLILKPNTNIIVIENRDGRALVDDIDVGALFMNAPIRDYNVFSTFILDKDNNVISYDNFNQMDNYSKRYRTFYFDNYVSKLIIVPMRDNFTLSPTVPTIYAYSYEDYLSLINELKEYPLTDVYHTYNTYGFKTDYQNYRFIVTNLAYDKGWDLTLTDSNGNITHPKVYKTTGGFVGFMSGIGECSYELNFVSEYFVPGLGLSAIGFGGLALFGIYHTLKKKAKLKEANNADQRVKIVKEIIDEDLKKYIDEIKK